MTLNSPWKWLWLPAVLAIACSSEKDESPEAQSLPNAFGDCGAAECEVSLEAFDEHCEATLEEANAALPCNTNSVVTSGTCDRLHAIRDTYAMSGDNYLCIYDETTGALVGARWTPDNHPRQYAGTQLPDSCELADDACEALLPTTFGDCGSMVCEVALEAFTANPGSIPYCDESLSEALASISCEGSQAVMSGTCDSLTSVQTTYGFPGDSYTCVYAQDTEELVGAIWSPDNHPTQKAGTLPGDGCTLTDPCVD